VAHRQYVTTLVTPCASTELEAIRMMAWIGALYTHLIDECNLKIGTLKALVLVIDLKHLIEGNIDLAVTVSRGSRA
jgi:hypothetical protein